ncbi:MAG: hypothetical protein IPP12_08900 [Nitrospira sp.]|nr:hypothetical protein [Nitrospira sp.]OYT21379.1 MAG: hypothetical protein CCU26_01725 [Nitrospira sp. UW-LDO-01]
MDRNAILSAWEVHCADGWPQFSSPHQGPLMTIDTVIGGCVVFYLDGSDGLDPQRRTILKDCLDDLDSLTEELDAECQPYFLRLRHLGSLLLDTSPTS